MEFSYNEFHISKKVRDLCNFEQGLFASSGNVVFANMTNVRNFQLLINNLFETRGEKDKKLSAGQLNAMGLIDEILHYMCMVYRRDQAPNFMKDLIDSLDKEYTKEEIDKLLLDFMKEFPPVEVYKEKITAEEYLSKTALDPGTGNERSNREQTLEELILLHLANENPAFQPFIIMFNEKPVAKNKLYNKTWAAIQKFSKTQPKYGPFNNDLINLLREPMRFSPDSLRGQLEYIRKYWDKILGEWLKRILTGLDTLTEEEKAAWASLGGDGPELQPYSFENLVNEYERFSPDSDWMPKVILMAKTVLVWLDQLTKQYGYPITRLDQIPDSELDTLRDEGFTGLWLIGLWERSKASKRVKQICGNPEAAASAYSLYDYNIAANIGGWDALANLRQRCWQRGIRVAADMVPNHTGMDGDWVMNRPDLFIQRRDCPFPQYSFNGENLSQDPRTSIYLEDHYYSKEDCAVVFKRVDNQTGDVRYIYHGNDGTGLPWNDTAQIDFLNPEAREAVMQEILHVARNFPIIRFDAAMVLAKKSIRRLWYPEPGHGGDIATRSETSLSTQEFNDAIPNEFWREVVDRVAAECPDTLLLAEAFWMMEGYFVRTLGMHRVYNSAFMNMLKKEENQKYRDTVKNTITFDPQILKRYVNFMNNPDEETAIAQFGDGDKYFGVCTLMVTMPGLPMFGHGQIEGYTEKYGMEYTKAYKDERPNHYLVDRHWREIFPLMRKRYLFSDVKYFLFYDLWENGHVNENVFAYSNGTENERTVVFYNNKYERACGWIKQSDPYAVKTGNGDEVRMESHSISEGLNLTAEDDKYTIFQEHKSHHWFIRKSSEICEKGLFVSLNGFESQVLLDVHQVADLPDHRYKVLCEYLNGKGCEDIEIAWQEILYKDLYESFAVFCRKILTPLFELFGINITSIPKNTLKDQIEKEEKLVKKAANKQNKSDVKVPELAKIDKVSKKAITSLLEKFKDECINFFRVTLRFIPEESVISPELEYEKVKDKLCAIAEIHNAEVLKTPKDLQKALQKTSDKISFVKLMMNYDVNLEKHLLCWAICGKLPETGDADKFAFGRKLNQFIHEFSLSDRDERADLTKLLLLSSLVHHKSLEKSSKKTAYKIVDFIVNGRSRYLLSGANTYDNVNWFNKETSDYSLNVLTVLFLLTSKDDEDVSSIFKLYRSLTTAKLKAAYKCDLFLSQFAPAEKKKNTEKTSAKSKTAKTKKKSTTAKTTKSTKKA